MRVVKKEVAIKCNPHTLLAALTGKVVVPRRPRFRRTVHDFYLANITQRTFIQKRSA